MTDRSRRRLIAFPLAVLTAAALASPALAGTDGDDEVIPAPTPAPFVQPTEAPPSVVGPAPAAPAPQTVAPVTTAAPIEESDSETKPAAKKAKTSPTAARKKTAVKSSTALVANTAAAAATPTGGVQAGGGGMAAQPTDVPLAGLLSGGLVLLLSGGGMRVLARR